MTEGVDSTTPLNPLMQSWLDDVSGLLQQVNDLGAELEKRNDFVAPEVVLQLRETIASLQEEVRRKDQELARQQSAERILANSITELQRDKREISEESERIAASLRESEEMRRQAVADANESRAEFERKLAEQAAEYEAREQRFREDAQAAVATARKLRLEIATEKVEGLKRAKAQLQNEHVLDIAKNHQIGKNKGIAIANAYIDAAKEENADLERASHLASSVVIQSAERIEAGLVIREASMVAEGGGNGGLPGTQQKIEMREDQVKEEPENNSRAILGFSRKMR